MREVIDIYENTLDATIAAMPFGKGPSTWSEMWVAMPMEVHHHPHQVRDVLEELWSTSDPPPDSPTTGTPGR